MELKEFVAETLKQVIEGVKAAQEGNDGKLINARILGGPKGPVMGGALVNAGALGMLTRIDFDVSVSAETEKGGAAKLSVFSLGINAKMDNKTTSENRITFSIPIRLPDGDTEQRIDALKKKKPNSNTATIGPKAV